MSRFTFFVVTSLFMLTMVAANSAGAATDIPAVIKG